MADRDRQFDEAEDEFAAAVADAMEQVADEFATALDGATELVAARFSVGRIARMWGARVSGLVGRLLGNVETAAEAAADDVDAELPEGWDDLPGRHETGRELPPSIGEYVETTEHLLNAVGDRLAEVARRELAAGLDAGEDIDQLRTRLRAAFSREGAQLGPGREHLVAQTESTRAWNTGTLAAGEALTGPDRPLVKQWLTRNDRKVRPDHARANGQLQLLDEPFTVGGVQMSAPGDPAAPPAQVCNCRCRLGLATATRTAASGSQESLAAGFSDARENGVDDPETVTAAATHTGAMIALVPTEADARRLALDVDGAEPWEELHLTLFYLGEGADWSDDQRAELIAGLRARLDEHGLPDDRIHGRAFGANQWNADGPSPCWVWSVGDAPDRPQDAPTLESARWAATYALEDLHGPGIPQQHTPWAGHVCAAYSDAPELLAELNDRLGPVTFDRIRVAFAGEHTDIPIGPTAKDDTDTAEEAPMDSDDTEERTAAGMTARPWHNPGDTALAYENAETGDGRVFQPGAIYWSGAGPWPLQYADEMLMGHEGAELAGAIHTVSRDGDRIPGTGVLYPNLPAGADALMLLEENAPLGVSVDLDDVSVEFIDRTAAEGDDEGEILLLASLPAASMLRLDDGSWSLTTSTAESWTASGAALSRTGRAAQLITGPGGLVPAAAVRAALEPTGRLTAAAGDPDNPDAGTVVHRESSGDLLMRVTRARLRGATLVAMPAYDQARIVLDGVDPDQRPEPEPLDDEEMQAAAGPSEAHLSVVAYVKGSPVAVGARDVANALSIRMEAARGHLGRAAKAGRLVRLSRGLYVGPNATESDIATAAAVVDEDTELAELEASAWTAMQQLPPMPAAWFKEPTAEELPPGSGGVHYANGRVFGWVAQAGVPHAGYPGKKITIERLAREGLDFSHFLRTEFELDDGTAVRVGAMTMNVGHDGDGAQCNDAVCQFDNSGTVGAIVTVGLNAGGLWFSGAGAPWLSDWDRKVFKTCQPSYHLRGRPGGGWELRAVLDVPVPGHSSPLVAAVIERSNLALAASAAARTTAGQGPDIVPDNSGQPTDTEQVTAADLPGQRPDTGPDNWPDTSGRREPLSSSHVDAVASALITSVPFIEGLAHALVSAQGAQTARRAEVANLARSIAAGTEPSGVIRDEVERLAASVFTTATATGGEA